MLDPRIVDLNYAASNGTCIYSMSYRGKANQDITVVDFPGKNCAGFTLRRE